MADQPWIGKRAVGRYRFSSQVRAYAAAVLPQVAQELREGYPVHGIIVAVLPPHAEQPAWWVTLEDATGARHVFPLAEITLQEED